VAVPRRPAGGPRDRSPARAADGHYAHIFWVVVDGHAMRATLLRCGYAKEAHYRDGWPGADGTVHDAVGYATPVPWGS